MITSSHGYANSFSPDPEKRNEKTAKQTLLSLRSFSLAKSDEALRDAKGMHIYTEKSKEVWDRLTGPQLRGLYLAGECFDNLRKA